MQFLHQLHLLKLFSPLISIPLFLSGCTTITYPDGTTVSTLNVPPPCEYSYGGGFPVYSTCEVGVYTGGYYPVYGNCFGSGWGTWGGWGWRGLGGCGYANNSGNTTVNVNRTTTISGPRENPYSGSINCTYGSRASACNRSMNGSYGANRNFSGRGIH